MKLPTFQRALVTKDRRCYVPVQTSVSQEQSFGLEFFSSVQAFYSTRESLRLDKTSKVIEFNLRLNTTMATKSSARPTCSLNTSSDGTVKIRCPNLSWMSLIVFIVDREKHRMIHFLVK